MTAAGGAFRTLGGSLPSWLGLASHRLKPVAAVAAMLVVWQVLTTVLPPRWLIPSPAAIFVQMHKDGWSFYWPNIATTLVEAGWGWFWGNLVAVVLALAIVARPRIEKQVMRFALAIYCLPIVAIGSILQIAFGNVTPKIVLAAMSVYFFTLVGLVSGLRSADPLSLDLVHAWGGSTSDMIRKIRFWSSLPSLFAALRVAAPAAILGAIIGEYLGGERGLGIIMLSSQRTLIVERTWGIALTAAGLAGAGYALTALIGKYLTPWAVERSASSEFLSGRTGSGEPGTRSRRDIGSLLLSAALTVVVLLGVWQLFLFAFQLGPVIGKGPLDVWRYLVTDVNAAAHRSALAHESLITFRDAYTGLAIGTAGALVVSVAFNVWPGLQSAVMPLAMILRSVPLVAITPLVVLIFGRGLLGVTVIVAIVTFFPTLVNVSIALSSAPRELVDLCKSFGASPLVILLKIRVPAALPALFVSLSVAAPLALVGALLAEWLATGKGLGYSMLLSGSRYDYAGLWARVALTTVYSIALYWLVTAAEQLTRDLLAGRFEDRLAKTT